MITCGKLAHRHVCRLGSLSRRRRRLATHLSTTSTLWRRFARPSCTRRRPTLRLRLSPKHALRRQAYHSHPAWTLSRALSRDHLTLATCLPTRKPPRMRRGLLGASLPAQCPLERISSLRALVFTCSLVLCLAGVVLPSPRPTLCTSDPSFSSHDALIADAQCAMVDPLHSSTAQDMSVIVDGTLDFVHTSAHIRSIDYSMDYACARYDPRGGRGGS